VQRQKRSILKKIKKNSLSQLEYVLDAFVIAMMVTNSLNFIEKLTFDVIAEIRNLKRAVF